MRSSPERHAGLENDWNPFIILGFHPGWDDPKLLADLERLIVLIPGNFPGLLFDEFVSRFWERLDLAEMPQSLFKLLFASRQLIVFRQPGSHPHALIQHFNRRAVRRDPTQQLCRRLCQVGMELQGNFQPVQSTIRSLRC